MGTSSPESSKSITNSNSSLLSNPIQAQESSVFSFTSYLSPIKPGNVAPVVQGFPGINTPPFIFRSPQIDQIRKKNTLRMTQFTRLSDGGLSRQAENVEDIDTVSERSGISSNQPKSSSISSPQKAFAIKNSPNAKVSSRPGSTNDYFPVMLNMDGGAFASSVNLSPKNSDEGFQSQNDLLHSKDSVEKTEDKDDTTKDKLTIGAPPANVEQAEEDDIRNSFSGLKCFESVEKLRDVCSNIDPESSADHTLDNQHGGQLKAENAGSGHLFEMAFTSQLGCMQIVQDSGSCENAVPFTASIENKMDSQNPTVGQHQHGICRRLQFQDGPGKTMADSGSQIASEATGYPRSPASPADPDFLESASLLQPVSQSNVLASMARAVFSPQDGGNYNIKVPKQSFGLHLNSIVARKVDFDMTVSVKSAVGGSFDGLEKGSISIMNRHLRKNSAISSNAVEGASLSSNDNMCDNHTPTGASYARSSYSIKPLCEPELLKSIQHESNHSNKRMCNSENFDSFGDFVKLSPKKRRKKTMDDGDNNGCKRCNCKKTKCLKLYCDCFAAGIYCAETCACQGCFNRPEFEDTVLDIRKQIESRNPLAFAPKIIQHISEPPTKVFAEDGDLTHSSGRHKRGCNCKKSKCSKKYCECYQANVGCSDGCRCEVCDNVYGRKEEYGTIRDLVSKQGNRQKLDSSYDVMLKGVAAKDSLLHNALYSPQNLTPLTPAFQYSDHGKGASRAFCHSESYLQSPESDLNLISSFGLSSRSAKSPDTSDMVLQTHTEIMDLVSFQQEINYVNGHTASQFSPRYDGPSNVGQHTAATLHNPQHWANSLRAQTFTGNRNVPSSGSLRWRSSHCNPSGQFEASTLHKVADNDNEPYSMIDDDTPEILKETSMPCNAVKISSPNKKRVSPPHGQQTELSYDSSVGLRSGRKFILKSVPSFPLTPCMNSQNACLNMDTSQSSSSSK